MDFFNTEEGRIHTGRVALVGYMICVVLSMVGHVSDEVGATLITFALGWWLAFCGKRLPRSWSEYTSGWRLRWGIQLSTTAVGSEIFRLLFVNKHY